jgi:hypothetical protein
MSNDVKTALSGHVVGPSLRPSRPVGPLGLCAVCLDAALTADKPIGDVPDAVVLVTVIQMFPAPGGQQMAAPVQMGVCVACRQQQLGTVSKAGLVTA